MRVKVVRRDLVVIGASAGGIEALLELLPRLPSEFPASILVVVHIPADAKSNLAALLARRSRMKVVPATDGTRIQPGTVYVAVPNRHLLLRSGSVLALTNGARENRVRPAIDPLFRSAARLRGPRVIAALLSGTMDDGVSGLIAVRNAGGKVLVQDPNSAQYSQLPARAIEHVAPDMMGDPRLLAVALERFTSEPIPAPPARTVRQGGPRATTSNELLVAHEVKTALMEPGKTVTTDRPGKPSGFACPECAGALWELDDSGLLRFRCRVGHAYTAQTLLDEELDGVEGALWAAIRALDEGRQLAARLADQARKRSHLHSSRRFQERARENERQAQVLRGLLRTRRP